jgi:hypothetical protein
VIGRIRRRHVDSRTIALKGARDARDELAGVREELRVVRRALAQCEGERDMLTVLCDRAQEENAQLRAELAAVMQGKVLEP